MTAVHLDDSWTYGTGQARILHGGYLVATASRAALTDDHPHPLAVSTHFLRPPGAGPAELEVEPLRTGRSTATTRVTVAQDGRPALDVVVTAGRLAAPGAPVWSDTRPVPLPPVEQCERASTPQGAARNGIVDNIDARYDPAARSGPPRGQVAAWLRFADGRPVGPLELLCLADALPPVTVPLNLPGWVPTVELTVHVRALPAAGWLRASQRARVLADGWLDEDCLIWDATGRLVAQAHQLAAYRA